MRLWEALDLMDKTRTLPSMSASTIYFLELFVDILATQAICVPIRRIAGKILYEAFENKVFIKFFLAESGVLRELPHCLRQLPPSSQSPSLNSIQSTGWDLLKGLVNLG